MFDKNILQVPEKKPNKIQNKFVFETDRKVFRLQ